MTEPKFPTPRTRWADCIWLPRIIEKARRLQNGTLPDDYAMRFGAPGGVDGQFLRNFGLNKEQILEAAKLPDAEVMQWFQGLPTATPEKIAAWNNEAVNLGRPGFPMAERMVVALATTYKHLAAKNPQTIFEALEADEAG